MKIAQQSLKYAQVLLQNFGEVTFWPHSILSHFYKKN